jgi:hypothetical protein
MAPRSWLMAHGLMPDASRQSPVAIPTFTSWTGRKRGDITEDEVQCSVFDILFGVSWTCYRIQYSVCFSSVVKINHLCRQSVKFEMG